MGKGGRCPETQAGRYARCGTPKPCWGSSKTAADCHGLGRHWKAGCSERRTPSLGRGGWKSADLGNSPAAYSTRSRPGGQSRVPPHPRRAEPRTTPGGQHWYSPLAILTALTLCKVCVCYSTVASPLLGLYAGSVQVMPCSGFYPSMVQTQSTTATS